MPSIVFLSNHVYDSRRRAGFHWLADAFAAADWNVTFVTTGVSLLSRLKKDLRVVDRKWGELRQITPRVSMMIEPAPVHPVTLPSPLIDALAAPFFAAYGKFPSAMLRRIAASADLLVFESSAALMFVPSLRQAAPTAKMIYRVSDDIRVIRNSPVLHTAEDRVIRAFDCISVPSRILRERRFGSLPTAHFHPHGLQKHLFDQPSPRPFPEDGRCNLVSLGSTLFDAEFIRLAAERHPQLRFHVVGKVRTPIVAQNVIHYDEVPFLEAAAFAKHADVCLAPYRQEHGAEYLIETSNKIAQYSYLRKPIIAPDFLVRQMSKSHLFGYDMDCPETIDTAIAGALACPAESVTCEEIESWESVRDKILDNVGWSERIASKRTQENAP